MARAHASSVINAPIEQVWGAFATSTACRTGIRGRQERDRGRHAIRSGRLRTRPDPAERRDPRAAARDVGPRTAMRSSNRRYPWRTIGPPCDCAGSQTATGSPSGQQASTRSTGEAGGDRGLHQQRGVSGRLRCAEQALRRLIASGFAAAVTTAATPLVIRPRASAPPARQCPSVRRSGRSDARMSRLRCRPERRAGVWPCVSVTSNSGGASPASSRRA